MSRTGSWGSFRLADDPPIRNFQGQFAKPRPRPPDLEFPPPPCPICDGDLEYDDGFYCVKCKASWDFRGQHGYWEDDYSSPGWASGQPRCPAEWEPFNHPDLNPAHEKIRHLRKQCSLNANEPHDKHIDDDYVAATFTDDDPRVVRKGLRYE